MATGAGRGGVRRKKARAAGDGASPKARVETSTNPASIALSGKSQKLAPLRFASVSSGRTCVGHIVARGRCGFEAFDVDDRSLGIFRDLPSAANTIERAAR